MISHMRTVYNAILDLIKACVLNGKKLDAMALTLEEIRQDVSLEVPPDQEIVDAMTEQVAALNKRLQDSRARLAAAIEEAQQ